MTTFEKLYEGAFEYWGDSIDSFLGELGSGGGGELCFFLSGKLNYFLNFKTD